MLGILGVDIPSNIEFPEAMEFIKDAIHSHFFMEARILLCWAIWTTRNALIFNNTQPQLSATRAAFFCELKLLTHRVKSSLSRSFDQWLQQIL